MKTYKFLKLGFLLPGFLFSTSCKKLVEIDSPKGLLVKSTVFSTNATATAAVVNIYADITVVTSIFNGNTSINAGLASDELKYTGTSPVILQIANNAILTNNSNINGLWSSAYKTIYMANVCIEGIEASTTLSPKLKSQLLGESYFFRAFAYFYLTNLFGPVPLVTSTNYQENATLERSDLIAINSNIKNDLQKAIAFLQPDYPTTTKTRVNKWAATALLARISLYEKDYQDAEKYASEVINSGIYSLETLDRTFLVDSKEAILEFTTYQGSGINTSEGNAYVPSPTGSSRPNYVLSPELLSSFEIGDQRRVKWIGTKTVAGTAYLFPYKYKKRLDFSDTYSVTENYVTLRLSDIILVRAEARANQGKLIGLAGAEGDLNLVRARAGLTSTTATTELAMLEAIEKERRVELFSEWGHRWFDLKRSGKVSSVLASIKGSNWQQTDQLFPIPESEILSNPSLIQNLGY